MTFPTPHTCDYLNERYSVREPEGIKYPWDSEDWKKKVLEDFGIGHPSALAYFDIPKPGSSSTANWSGYRFGYTLFNSSPTLIGFTNTGTHKLFITSIWVLSPKMSMDALIKGNAKWIACQDKTGKVSPEGYVKFSLKEPVDVEFEEIELTNEGRLLAQHYRLGWRLEDGKTMEEEERAIDEEFGAPIVIKGAL
jgi:hypothetical protein